MRKNAWFALMGILGTLWGTSSPQLNIDLSGPGVISYRIDKTEDACYVRLLKPQQTFRFARPEDVASWNTDLVWDDPNVTQGKVTFSPEFGGSACLHVEGTPCFVNFWKELPVDLEYGDEIIVRFYTKKPSYNFAGFEVKVGPISNGSTAIAQVSVTSSGEHIVNLPIWAGRDFRKGTLFGIRASVWPGEMDFYISSITIFQAK